MVKFILFFVLACCLVSCRSVKSIVEHKDLPYITENKLLKNIYANELNYNTLYAKRLDVSIIQKGESNSFKASLKIRRDSFIQVSVTAPLGIELARVLLTPDSVKFVSPFGKKYFTSDYRYFSDKFDANVSYDCFQKILTNTFFNIENCNGGDLKERKYKFERTNENYVLSTVEEKALSRKIKKLYKKKKKNKEYVLIMQKIEINPEWFRPVSMAVEDMDEHVGVSVDYKNFKDFGGKIFPEKIVFNLFSGEGKTNLEIGFSKLEFDVDVEPSFKISSKYKRIDY